MSPKQLVVTWTRGDQAVSVKFIVEQKDAHVAGLPPEHFVQLANWRTACYHPNSTWKRVQRSHQQFIKFYELIMGYGTAPPLFLQRHQDTMGANIRGCLAIWSWAIAPQRRKQLRYREEAACFLTSLIDQVVGHMMLQGQEGEPLPGFNMTVTYHGLKYNLPSFEPEC